MSRLEILVGDCRHTLHDLEDGSVQCCVTSPPPWGAPSRLPANHPDVARAVGSAPSPYRHVAELAAVFRLVRRKLRDDGTLWLHLSDVRWNGSLFGLPWRVAILLQADHWKVVADLVVCVLHQPQQGLELDSPPVHSRLFVLAKSDRYSCGGRTVLEPMLNRTFVHEAVELGSRPGDVILDPFGGDGGTAKEALLKGRHAVVCELSPERALYARERLKRYGEIE
jgi:DNA modification methylase